MHLSCISTHTGNAHDVREYVPHRNATMAALTCLDKKTGKSVFGVATHVLTLWAVSELQQVEGLSAALRVDMKELTRAQLRAWRDEIVLKLDCRILIGLREVRAAGQTCYNSSQDTRV